MTEMIHDDKDARLEAAAKSGSLGPSQGAGRVCTLLSALLSPEWPSAKPDPAEISVGLGPALFSSGAKVIPGHELM